MIEVEVFEFIEELETVNSLSELEKLFLKFARTMGIELFVCAQILNPGGGVARETLFGSTGHQWFNYYKSQHLFYHDLVIQRATQTNSPILWSEIAQERLTRTERLVMEEPRNFSLADGLTIPIHGARGEVAALTVAGPHFVFDRKIETVVQLMALKSHRRAVQLRGPAIDHIKASVLSPRQRECLHWSQFGKTNEEIATILGISAHTVKDHIDAAKAEFGVSSKLEAVIAARRANLIGL